MRHQTKPTIMILGSSHLANPRMDGSNRKINGVFAPKHQSLTHSNILQRNLNSQLTS